MTISAEQLEQLLELDDLGTNLALAHAIAIVAQDEALTGAQLMRPIGMEAESARPSRDRLGARRVLRRGLRDEGREGDGPPATSD